MRACLLFFVLSIIFTIPIVAQSGSALSEEVLVVEFLIPEASLGSEKTLTRYEIPKDFDFKSKVFIGGVSSTVGCIDCRLIADYGLFIFNADRVNPDETVVRLAANFTQAKKCNADRTIRIANNRKNTVRLKCGVTAKIYYDSPKKEMSHPTTPIS